MSRVGSLIRGAGLITITALGLSACGGTGFDESSATKIIQSVDVDLNTAGAITEVGSSAVYLDELSGTSNSSTDDYIIEEVIEDLPVRVSTQYTTEDGSGSDLDDLEGHTGRVEIAIAVENLTLTSTEVTYDVTGETRQSSALVGTPLSVAGAVELENTTASNVVVDLESDNTTNGVVSQTPDGDAVVQWGTVLAPPQSEAIATFQLIADVEDFVVPKFDLAVQAGFHTDMSFEGMLASAFETGAGSEHATYQQAIELVADINEVLTRAGTTVTEIREVLDHTTDTLGVEAAQQLQQNSDGMVKEMLRISEQLAALETQVEGSVRGAETATNSQLAQIVASMNGMLGNTKATAPRLSTGPGCAATVEDAESDGSLYSTFLVLGAQLDGYAQANAECRDEIVAGIQDTLGPEDPEPEVCKDHGASITCALFGAQSSVLTSLNDLANDGEKIIEELDDQEVSKAQKHSANIGTQLASIRDDIDAIRNPEDAEEPGERPANKPRTWRGLNRKVTSARFSLNGLKIDVGARQRDAKKDLEARTHEIADKFNNIKRETNAIGQDHNKLALRICDLELAGSGDSDVLDELSRQLVGHACDETSNSDDDEASLRALTDRVNDLVDGTHEETLETLRSEQEEHWQAALNALDIRDEDSAVAKLDASLAQLQEDLQRFGAEDSEQDRQIAMRINSIERAVIQAQANHEDVTTSLENLLDEYQENLPDEIRAAFQKVIDDTAQELPESIDAQVRVVTDRINNAQDAVVNSYNATVAGLVTTSDTVVNDTAKQLNEQEALLEDQQNATTQALSASTTSALESIHASTTSSSRDLEGASAQLGASLNNVILDLGDPDVQGSGILGSMAASSAMSDTADYQLALASQRAGGYANVRSEDVAEIMLRQAQFSASLEAANNLPVFHLDVPTGARTQTNYAFHIGGDDK